MAQRTKRYELPKSRHPRCSRGRDRSQKAEIIPSAALSPLPGGAMRRRREAPSSTRTRGGSKEATMAQTFTGRKRVRKFFGKIEEVAEMPNLIEVQKASYDQFLLVKEPPGGRPDEGLQAVFRSVFPISDFSNTAQLEFVRYEFEAPKYDV